MYIYIHVFIYTCTHAHTHTHVGIHICMRTAAPILLVAPSVLSAGRSELCRCFLAALGACDTSAARAIMAKCGCGEGRACKKKADRGCVTCGSTRDFCDAGTADLEVPTVLV